MDVTSVSSVSSATTTMVADTQQKVQAQKNLTQSLTQAEIEKQQAAKEAAKRAADEKQAQAVQLQQAQAQKLAQTQVQGSKGGNLNVFA
jgi:hypothetical protein